MDSDSARVREAACAIPVRARADGTHEIFLVRRSPALEFLGGFDVFPGGTTDPVDAALAAQRPALALEPRGWTALRELFEETGVLAFERAADLDADARRAMRQGLLDGDAAAWQAYAAQAKPLRLWPMGRWITPPYTPVLYDASYFGVLLEAEAAPDVWPGELVSGVWVSAAEAIQRHHGGALFISYPVLETIKGLQAGGADLQGASTRLSARDDAEHRGGGEILRGVFVRPVRTFTLPPATHTNCYLVGGRDLVIIDPATPIEDEQRELVAFCEHLQRRGHRLVEIWLTHHHKDHIGAVQAVREAFGLPVAAHRLTAESVAPEITVERLLEDGDVREFAYDEGPPSRWVALHTPGHARGHLCFFEERTGTLISGDNVLGLGTVLIAPPEGNMVDYFASLHRMRALARGFLLPAHGPPVATAAAKIDFYLAHRTQREESILASVRGGACTSEEIVQAVYTDIDPRALGLAEINVKAHLEKLVAERRVVQDGARFFAALASSEPLA